MYGSADRPWTFRASPFGPNLARLGRVWESSSKNPSRLRPRIDPPLSILVDPLDGFFSFLRLRRRSRAGPWSSFLTLTLYLPGSK